MRASVVSGYRPGMARDLGSIDRTVRPHGRQIAAVLAERIGTPVLPWRSLLPSYVDLAAYYGVSVAAVRYAVRELAREGLVVVRQGHRTRVADEQP